MPGQRVTQTNDPMGILKVEAIDAPASTTSSYTDQRSDGDTERKGGRGGARTNLSVTQTNDPMGILKADLPPEIRQVIQKLHRPTIRWGY